MNPPEPDSKLVINPEVPYVLYLRYMVNLILSDNNYAREDAEQLTREYEAKRIPDSSEKQLVARTRNYLSQLFGRHIIDWPTICVFFKILKSKRIQLSITLYNEQDIGKTYSVLTEPPKESTDVNV